MPGQAPPVADEREGLAAYIRQQQDAFRIVAFGLTDAQAAQKSTVSSLTVGALIKHATTVQSGWLARVEAAPGRSGADGRPQQEQQEDYLAQFTFGQQESLADVLDRFDAVSARLLDAVDGLDLDTPVPVPPAPWNPRDIDAWSVRWVWLHLVEELARHAGHADIIREAIDGATMYELMAGYEGWPATPWIKPWSPQKTASTYCRASEVR